MFPYNNSLIDLKKESTQNGGNLLGYWLFSQCTTFKSKQQKDKSTESKSYWPCFPILHILKQSILVSMEVQELFKKSRKIKIVNKSEELSILDEFIVNSEGQINEI